MSAFLVSDLHIDILVHARHFSARGGGCYLLLQSELSDNDLGKMLTIENHKSLDARYGDNVPEVVFVSKRIQFEPTIPEMIKAIHCYEYQSSEHEGWEKSDARRYCRDLERQLVRKLPGYEDAPWGWEQSHANKKTASLY